MSRPWMPLYVADYLADTGHLSTLEHGAYLLLIMHYWSKGGLPDDDKRLASIARASLEQWADMRSTIAEFFDDGWKHARIDEELESAKRAYERRASAGRAGGKAKAASQQSPSIATALPEQSHSQPLKEKEPPVGGSKKRGSRLSENWVLPDEWLEEAVAAGLTRSQAFDEAERMKNWSLSATGGTKLDWRAAWRNWFRSALERKTPRAPPPPSKPRNAGEAARQELIRRGQYPNATSNPPRLVDTSDGNSGFAGTGIARRIALAASGGRGT